MIHRRAPPAAHTAGEALHDRSTKVPRSLGKFTEYIPVISDCLFVRFQNAPRLLAPGINAVPSLPVLDPEQLSACSQTETTGHFGRDRCREGSTLSARFRAEQHTCFSDTRKRSTLPIYATFVALTIPINRYTFETGRRDHHPGAPLRPIALDTLT